WSAAPPVPKRQSPASSRRKSGSPSVISQVRNSLRCVVWKEKNEFTADMKQIYHAATIEAAEQALENFEKKWGHKYAYAVKSWKNNWENLTQFFEYPLEIRKIVYTTNIIENLNRGIRKYTKTKSIFPHDQAALKAVYLTIGNIENKWTMPIRNWGMILQQFLYRLTGADHLTIIWRFRSCSSLV
ncbi:MAG: transposase, partial [Bacteroidota bacterium]|nr:transposase [Bacteroidota bacterium]